MNIRYTLAALFHLEKGFSKSQRRHSTLLGQAISGQKGNMQLEMLSRLRAAEAPEELFSLENFFGKATPVIANRLGNHLLKSLLFHDAHSNPSAQLALNQFGIEAFFGRKQYDLAEQAAEEGEKLALESGNYPIAIQCRQWIQRIQHAKGTPWNQAAWEAWKAQMQTLQYFASTQLALYQDWQFVLHQFREFPKYGSENEESILRIWKNLRQWEAQIGPDLLSQSLLLDLKAFQKMLKGKGNEAIPILSELMEAWAQAPRWIETHPDFYFIFFKHFQTAIFYGTTNPTIIDGYLSRISTPKNLQPTQMVEIDRLIYHHQIMMALNSGALDWLTMNIPKMLDWLNLHIKAIRTTSRLTFLHNFMVAYFLAGNFSQANKINRLIAQVRNPGTRKDIVNCAKIFQIVLMYELEETDLAGYLVRASKRHFSKDLSGQAFEKVVLDFFRTALKHHPRIPTDTLHHFAQSLQALKDGPSNPIQLTGINEISIWVHAKLSGRQVGEVFLEAIQEIKLDEVPLT